MRAVAKLVLGCALVAAVATPAAAAPAKAKKACGLLKTSEIEKEFGDGFEKPQSGPGPACNWELVVGGDPGAVGSGTVGTFLLRTQAKTAFDSNRETFTDATDVSGVGKDAFFTPQTGTLWVLKNSKTMIYVQAVFIGENVGQDQDAVPDLEAKVTTLAKKALKRA